MSAFNVVRVRVRPGREQAFVDIHREFGEAFPGLRRLSLVGTGDRTYCLIGEWDSMQHIVEARPDMIAQLDRMRGLLEDLGQGLGVTDPVSGEVVLQYPAD